MARLQYLREKADSSLFFVPMLFVVGAIALGELMVLVDGRIDDVPTQLTATVDSARSVLSVVAGATLSFAGIAFSVSLLVLSMASNQYSPRVVHGLFRDPFNKRIMGIVVGTFTYCLVVMRAVRGPLEDDGAAVIPSLAILVAVVLGIVSVLSIVGFISHSAHATDVSRILHRVTEEALRSIEATWPEDTDEDAGHDVRVPEEEGFAVTFTSHGWVQQIDHEALLTVMEAGSCMALETGPGRYAIPRSAICTVWPVPEDTSSLTHAVRAAVFVGQSRTLQADAAYGLRQLADVALRALSPGMNDPTTAQDAIFHLGAVLNELLLRSTPPTRIRGEEGRVVLRPEAATHVDLIDIAFDEIRIAASALPTVQIYLLEVIALLCRSLDGDASPEMTRALRRQADLVLGDSATSDVGTADRERVRAAHRTRFDD